jgi:hypothetical protein
MLEVVKDGLAISIRQICCSLCRYLLDYCAVGMTRTTAVVSLPHHACANMMHILSMAVSQGPAFSEKILLKDE